MIFPYHISSLCVNYACVCIEIISLFGYFKLNFILKYTSVVKGSAGVLPEAKSLEENIWRNNWRSSEIIFFGDYFG